VTGHRRKEDLYPFFERSGGGASDAEHHAKPVTLMETAP